MLNRVLTKIAILMVLALVVQFSCTKKESQKVESKYGQEEIAAETRTEDVEDLKAKEEEIAKMRKETESLLDLLREKEAALAVRDAQLDSIEQDLQRREQHLAESEAAVKRLRNSSYIILFFGIVLFVVSLVLFLGRRKPSEETFKKLDEQPAAKKVPEVKNDKSTKKSAPTIKKTVAKPKAVEKPAKKAESTTKAVEKPKRTRTTKTTGAKRTTPKTTGKASGEEPKI